MSNTINGRGRKREARRWLMALGARVAAIQPPSKRRPRWDREHKRLRHEDPGLAEAVSQCLLDDIAKTAFLTHEERRAQMDQRVEKLQREQRRGERQLTSA